jgi:hypothetical protein
VDGGFPSISGGGGGATDIRTAAALASRLLVAGGGGGGGGFGLGPGPNFTGGPAGGDGGDSAAIGTQGSDNTASTGGQPGGGGTIGGGGSGGAPGTGAAPLPAPGGTGGLGVGGLPGAGASGEEGGGGGGGGGGFFGGGGGGGGARQAGLLGAGGGGGGGGSSHADPAASAVAIDDGVRAGSGQVVISFTPAPPAPSAVHKPKTRITGTPGKKKHKRRHSARLYTFKFADDIPGVTFLCQLDQAPFEPCSSPKTYRNLKPGKHTFRVKSVDSAGVESDPQTVSFRARARPKK